MCKKYDTEFCVWELDVKESVVGYSYRYYTGCFEMFEFSPLDYSQYFYYCPFCGHRLAVATVKNAKHIADLPESNE